MSDDTVMVQPVRTFLEGPDLKHPESEPYQVSRSRMMELRGNGLVEHIESEMAQAADVLPVDADAPRRRGRPPKAR